MKVVLIGEPGVGKTALLDCFNYKKITKTQQPTIGADFIKKKATLSDGKTVVQLQLWDTAGQERFQSLCVNFYRGADCCVMVYDVTLERTYEKLDKWRQAFGSAANADEVPFVIIGNKSDMGVRVNPFRVKEEWIDNGKAQAHF